MAADACQHENFAAFADVARLTRSDEDPTVIAFSCSLKVDCADCGESFRFIGLPVGDVADRPMGSFDSTEARLPIAPVSAPDDFGMERYGFTFRQRMPGAETN